MKIRKRTTRMPKKSNTIVVVDVESTCWRDHPPAGQESEIIQIGVTNIDVASLGISRHGAIFVKPSRSMISEFCTELTGIKQEDVDNGVSLEDACNYLADFGAREYPWASYGDYDRTMFERNCLANGISYPFGKRHVNVKTLLAIVLGQNEVGMDRALDRLGIKLQGKHHDAGDDSKNIAHILCGIVRAARQGGLGAALPA